eukprot:COSAG01_NODE_492_length_16335_cov_63.722284_11_plen_86_part_00
MLNYDVEQVRPGTALRAPARACRGGAAAPSGGAPLLCVMLLLARRQQRQHTRLDWSACEEESRWQGGAACGGVSDVTMNVDRDIL